MLRFGNDAMRNMFKSLGEEAIESNLVTRVITSAQTRVEGYNFDVRKNLLGYDDVLRQQREIMYKQRDDVIFTENAHPIVIDLFGKVAQDIVDKSIYYEAKEPLVDIAKVKKQLIPQFIREEALDLEVINGLSPNKTVEAIKDLLISFFERNKALWGEKVFLSVEKQILIRIIDLNWTQHIDRMSKLRDGIHLRAYAQTNPLQSYINEGYQMFQDMVLRIAYETCVYCLHAVVKFEKKPIPPENKDADKKD
jgi:preprotein translocase subunit SecA